MLWWFWVWIAFIIIVILLPTGYGWGRRGWGPPSPRYRYRGRRGNIVEYEVVDPPPEDYRQPHVAHGWGLAGDLIWLAILGALIWIIVWAWV